MSNAEKIAAIRNNVMNLSATTRVDWLNEYADLAASAENALCSEYIDIEYDALSLSITGRLKRPTGVEHDHRNHAASGGPS